ncbi:hypothetical protein [Aliarcobacter butzleri]|uniref:hypothetical protein n=1 Tax=Aliarcobacter butzleri TaxID=28197 RepID=UPI0021B38A74|nr:hypothetical protein [Aliarcobacter butzleri]MCT7561970.1 hypothetical protein [Aliarcobacter butzleri]
MSRIYQALEKLYKIPLVDMATKLNYHKSNIYILKDKFDLLKKDFPEIYNDLLTCIHQKDNRTYQEYAKDLISSWIFEDTLLKYLSNSKLEVVLSGSDKNRIILKNAKVETTADYLIKKQNKQRYIELINSYTPYWANTKRIELRDNKYLKMKEKNVLLLCIDIYSNIFYIINIAILENIRFIEYHKAYGKPAYSIDIKDLIPYELSLLNLIKQIEIAMDS